MSRSSQHYTLPYPIHNLSQIGPPVLRPTKAFVTHIPVNGPVEAKVLSRQVAWDILSHIRGSGSNGVSASEISTSLGIPLGEAYSTLRELMRLELVFKVPRTARVRRGRRKRYVSDKVSWKKYSVDRALTRMLNEEGGLRDLTERLEEPVLMALTQARELLSKTEFNSQLPFPGREGQCHRCGMNHEALDFFNALAVSFVTGLMEGKAFKNFLHSLGFSDRN